MQYSCCATNCVGSFAWCGAATCEVRYKQLRLDGKTMGRIWKRWRRFQNIEAEMGMGQSVIEGSGISSESYGDYGSPKDTYIGGGRKERKEKAWELADDDNPNYGEESSHISHSTHHTHMVTTTTTRCRRSTCYYIFP